MSFQSFQIRMLAAVGTVFVLAGCAPDDATAGGGVQSIEGAALVATPASIALGRVAVGAEANVVVRLTNRGVEDVDITRVYPPDPCRANLIVPCVRPGETISMTVTCTPTAAGTFGGDVVLWTESGRVGGDMLRVAVGGTGYEAR